MTALSRITFAILTIFLLLCCELSQGLGLCNGRAQSSEKVLLIPRNRLQTILSNVEKNLGRIRTLKTKLVQENNIALFSEPVLSKGILLFKSPSNIRLEFFEPFQSVLLVSERKVSKFEKFNGKWKRMDSTSVKMMAIILDHIAAWVKGQFNRDNIYHITGLYRHQKEGDAYSIILEPKAEEFKKFIQAFEIGINSDMNRLDYIIIRESVKDYTKISFSDDRINLPIEDIYFAGDEKPLSSTHKW